MQALSMYVCTALDLSAYKRLISMLCKHDQRGCEVYLYAYLKTEYIKLKLIQ